MRNQQDKRSQAIVGVFQEQAYSTTWAGYQPNQIMLNWKSGPRIQEDV